MHSFKKIIGLTLTLVLVLSLSPVFLPPAEASAGTPFTPSNINNINGINYRRFARTNGTTNTVSGTGGGVAFNTPETVAVLEIAPGANARLMTALPNWSATHGHTVERFRSVGVMAQQYTNAGYNVIAAINGGFFGQNVPAGTQVPLQGAMISNGELIRHWGPGGSNEYISQEHYVVGTLKNGTVFHGHNPTHVMNLSVNGGAPRVLQALNSPRSDGNVGWRDLTLLTDSFAPTIAAAGSRLNGRDVRLEVLAGRMAFGEDLIMRVVQASHAAVNNAAIAPGQARLIASNAEDMAFLATLSVGDIVTINHTVTNRRGTTVDWTQVEQAIAAHFCLIRDGVRQPLPGQPGALRATSPDITPNASTVSPLPLLPSQNTRRPRTGVGIRADGTMVWVVVSGGGTTGMTMPQFQAYLMSLNLRHAWNFDGGGSATMVVGHTLQTYGDGAASTYQRPVANGLILVSPRPPATTAHAVTIGGIPQGNRTAGQTVTLDIPVRAGYHFRTVTGLTGIPTTLTSGPSGRSIRFVMPNRAVNIGIVADTVPQTQPSTVDMLARERSRVPAGGAFWSAHGNSGFTQAWSGNNLVLTYRAEDPVATADFQGSTGIFGRAALITRHNYHEYAFRYTANGHAAIGYQFGIVSADSDAGHAGSANHFVINSGSTPTANNPGWQSGSRSATVPLAETIPVSALGDRLSGNVGLSPASPHRIVQGFSVHFRGGDAAARGQTLTISQLDLIHTPSLYTVNAAAGITFADPNTLAAISAPAGFTAGQTVVVVVGPGIEPASLLGFAGIPHTHFTDAGRNLISFAMPAANVSIVLPSAELRTVTFDGIVAGTFTHGTEVRIPLSIRAGYIHGNFTDLAGTSHRVENGVLIFTMPNRNVNSVHTPAAVPRQPDKQLFAVHSVPDNQFQWRAGTNWISETSMPLMTTFNAGNNTRYIGIHTDAGAGPFTEGGDRTDVLTTPIFTFVNPAQTFADYSIDATCQYTVRIGIAKDTTTKNTLVQGAAGTRSGSVRLTDLNENAGILSGWSFALTAAMPGQGLTFSLNFVEKPEAYKINTEEGLTFVNPATFAVLTPVPADFTPGQTVVMRIADIPGRTLVGFGGVRFDVFTHGGGEYISFAMPEADMTVMAVSNTPREVTFNGTVFGHFTTGTRAEIPLPTNIRTGYRRRISGLDGIAETVENNTLIFTMPNRAVALTVGEESLPRSVNRESIIPRADLWIPDHLVTPLAVTQRRAGGLYTLTTVASPMTNATYVQGAGGHFPLDFSGIDFNDIYADIRITSTVPFTAGISTWNGSDASATWNILETTKGANRPIWGNVGACIHPAGTVDRVIRLADVMDLPPEHEFHDMIFYMDNRSGADGNTLVVERFDILTPIAGRAAAAGTGLTFVNPDTLNALSPAPVDFTPGQTVAIRLNAGIETAEIEGLENIAFSEFSDDGVNFISFSMPDRAVNLSVHELPRYDVTFNGELFGDFIAGTEIRIPFDINVMAGFTLGIGTTPDISWDIENGNVIVFEMPDRNAAITAAQVPAQGSGAASYTVAAGAGLTLADPVTFAALTPPVLFREGQTVVIEIAAERAEEEISGLDSVAYDRFTADGRHFISFVMPDESLSAALPEIVIEAFAVTFNGNHFGDFEESERVEIPIAVSVRVGFTLTVTGPADLNRELEDGKIIFYMPDKAVEFTAAETVVLRGEPPFYTVKTGRGISFANPETMEEMPPPANFSAGQTVVIEINTELGGVVINGLDGIEFSSFSVGERSFISFAMPSANISVALTIPGYGPGEILGRGTVTVADASLAFRGLLGLVELTPEQEFAAALDGGTLTIGHVLRIFRYALGLSNTL
jgi:hypothetical protein